MCLSRWWRIQISATGVVPSSEVAVLAGAIVDGDGAVCVDHHMQSSLRDVHAAGDVASVQWPDSPAWFQMRLWRQARAQGLHAAQCMASVADDISAGMSFEVG